MKNKTKAITLFAVSLFFCPLAFFAQVDDIYYSKKDAENDAAKIEAQKREREQQIQAAKNKQRSKVVIEDTDEYVDNEPIIVTDENDYVYSQRLNKYHNADINIYTDTDDYADMTLSGNGTTNIYIINSGYRYGYNSPYWGFGFWGSTWAYDPWYYNPWWYYRPYSYWYSPYYYRPYYCGNYYYGNYYKPYYHNTHRPAPRFQTTNSRSGNTVRSSPPRTVIRSNDVNRSSTIRGSSSTLRSNNPSTIRSQQNQSRNTDVTRNSNTQSQRSSSTPSVREGNTRSEPSSGGSVRGSSGESSRGNSSSSYSSGSSRSSSNSSSYSSGSSSRGSSSSSSGSGGSRGGSSGGGGRGR